MQKTAKLLLLQLLLLKLKNFTKNEDIDKVSVYLEFSPAAAAAAAAAAKLSLCCCCMS